MVEFNSIFYMTASEKKKNISLQNAQTLEAKEAGLDIKYSLSPALSPDLASAVNSIFSDENTSGNIKDAIKTAKSKEKPHHTGHRSRLREKYIKHGKDVLHNYEFLELILSVAIPRRDVKPLAKDLLQQFNTVGNILTAPKEQLQKIKGLGDYSLFIFKLLCDSAELLQLNKIGQKTILSNWSAVSNYAQQKMGHLKHEEFHIWFLDESCGLIAEECLSKGTINRTAIYPREVVKKALDHHASHIILLHNHPSGDTTPSGADVNVTTKIYDALYAIDINLFDHLIVGKDNITSFRTLGLLGD